MGEDVGDDEGAVVEDAVPVGDFVLLAGAMYNFRSIPHVLSKSIFVTFNLFPITSTSNVSIYQASMLLHG